MKSEKETNWMRCRDRNGKPCKACDEVISSGKGITWESYNRMIDSEFFLPLDLWCAEILARHGEAHSVAWKKYYKLVDIEKDGKKDFIIEEIKTN